MALKKDILFRNGVLIKYHKVNKVSFDNGIVSVDILSYSDDSFRKIEKENDANKKKYEELVNKIFEENQKPLQNSINVDGEETINDDDFRNTENVILWSNEANALVGTFDSDMNLSVMGLHYTFEGITDLSLNNIYNLLKKEEVFEGAIDI